MRILPRTLALTSAPREIADSVNAVIDTLRITPPIDVVTTEVEQLRLPFTLFTEVESPVFVAVNVWTVGDKATAPGLTEFSWQPTESGQFQVTTLAGLTLGESYEMTFLVVGS